MAFTARLPADLQAEADAYAAKLGISLNALLAVSLRDYLDARRPSQSSEGQSLPVAAVQLQARPVTPPAPPAAVVPVVPKVPKAPVNPMAPCPCGRKTPLGSPIRWKFCHGKAA